MKKSLQTFLFTILLVALCIVWLDEPVAVWIHAEWLSGSVGETTLEIPDLLLPLVVAVTAFGWLGRFRFKSDPCRRNLQRCCALLGVVAPGAYLARALLKFVFGRIETRAWLVQPGSTGFHWFGGFEPYNGFPSGHMLVCAALAAVLWRSYPKFAVLYAAGLLVLAASLILTDYHFLGDVIAGAYAGLLVHGLIATPTALRLFRIPSPD